MLGPSIFRHAFFSDFVIDIPVSAERHARFGDGIEVESHRAIIRCIFASESIAQQCVGHGTCERLSQVPLGLGLVTRGVLFDRTQVRLHVAHFLAASGFWIVVVPFLAHEHARVCVWIVVLSRCARGFGRGIHALGDPFQQPCRQDRQIPRLRPSTWAIAFATVRGPASLASCRARSIPRATCELLPRPFHTHVRTCRPSPHVRIHLRRHHRRHRRLRRRLRRSWLQQEEITEDKTHPFFLRTLHPFEGGRGRRENAVCLVRRGVSASVGGSVRSTNRILALSASISITRSTSFYLSIHPSPSFSPALCRPISRPLSRAPTIAPSRSHTPSLTSSLANAHAGSRPCAWTGRCKSKHQAAPWC
mmetsp:Transcript_3105/g.19142  ORF Transcript_3105/g.19142 Transcript_3105/m.19142 type:complete len:362 (+) Transcript_3105:843-1928(+)